MYLEIGISIVNLIFLSLVVFSEPGVPKSIYHRYSNSYIEKFKSHSLEI